MQLGGFFIWTHTYTLMKEAGAIYAKSRTDERSRRIPNRELDADVEAHLLKMENEEDGADQRTTMAMVQAEENQTVSRHKLKNC